nr:DUF4296 domain-containing protein [Pontibacter vulgaris]
MLGCQKQTPKPPENLVTKEKMVQILADVHEAEARIESKMNYPDTAMMTFNHAQKLILKKHGVSEKKFRDTYDYYLEHLVEMDKLYEIIIDTLSVRESKAKIKEGQAPEAEGDAQQPAPYRAL